MAIGEHLLNTEMRDYFLQSTWRIITNLYDHAAHEDFNGQLKDTIKSKHSRLRTNGLDIEK